ncbi:hypothetical protein SAMN05443634_10268 [Chishuiella changwenlii]|uniref:TraB family protein n=1 Tax=Chishuiella changwenlii TaxID=1434701 RepID=A0A1M6TS08_9FLAO|nr:hypothetical protein [Chishuiella changwenlii]GGF04161.1 hypothetical protein GCM10010984_21850 [Chishuiella changwenlii]SHK59751.1 hypothetical protein SAMN05443634_10268 [Chishuiella changwenlii]
MKQLHILILFLVSTISFSQEKKTEIFIIGNIHDSVANYNPKILLTILENIKPDIILHEVDSEGMREYETDANFKGNEIRASNLYLKKNSKTLRFPFDFEGRNKYRRDRGMVPTDNLTIKLIDSLYNAKKLTKEQIKIYETFNNITGDLMKIAESSPENFNNKKTDSIAELRQNFQYQQLLKITNERPEFSKNYIVKPNKENISYKDGFKLMSDFWDLRNKTMAKNIYDISEKYPNKKIVVLTGFLHRYYLIKELRKLNNGSYTIKEFYEP